MRILSTRFQQIFQGKLGQIIRILTRGISSPHPVRTVSRITGLTSGEISLLNSKWYHDFKNLGFKTEQYNEHHRLNQVDKQQPIENFLVRALVLCKNKNILNIEGVELFCGDGYYSNMAIKLGVTKMLGVDINESDIIKGRLITKILGNQEKISLEIRNVFTLDESYDLGICAGGLYHLEKPEELLRLLASRIRTALVIQTVYSLARTEPDYFETPAPGWTWGCRFSYDYLLNMVNQAGWEIVAVHKNILCGNTRLEDRGSAYILCIPK